MKVFGFIVSGLGVASVSLFLAGIVLGMGRLLPARIAFGLSALGMVLGILAVFGALIVGVRSGFDARVAAGLLGLPGAVVLVYSLVSTRGAPLINDVSTNITYPPQFEHAQTLPANHGRNMSLPEAFKPQIEEGYPDLDPLALQWSRDDAFIRIHELAKQQPNWTITSTSVGEKESTIEGYATTQVYGFVDDFVIRITDADEGVVVDMRSKSRDGRGDLGANAARIQAFFEQIRS